MKQRLNLPPLWTGILLCITLAVRSSAEDRTGEIEQLKTRVADLEQRVAALEKLCPPKISVTIDYAEEKAADSAAAAGPVLTAEQRTALAAAQARVEQLEEDVRKHGGPLAPTPGIDRETVVARWAAGASDLVGLLAAYGQEPACVTALAMFRAGSDRTSRAQAAFAEAAYQAAVTFRDRWRAPDAAMRLAATYGPRDSEVAADWGALCETCAQDTGRDVYAALALRCYLRAVAFNPNQPRAWERIRALKTLEARMTPAE